ncbi:MAG: thioredoxin family protein [Candidatus Diapherotrites archaeon]
MVLTPSNYSVLRKGSVAPNFSLLNIDGKKYSLPKPKEKKGVLVVFMCNHCPYVKPKMPFLKYLYDTYAKRGLSMFGINSNDTNAYSEDDFENMKRVSKEQGFGFPYLLDETQEIAKAYGAACTPDPFLFDSELRLVYHGRIDNAHMQPHEKATTNELEDAIKQLLEGKKVNVKEEPSIGCNVKWKSKS